MKMQLTQQIVISNKSSKFAQLDELCFLSKNLYNVALYKTKFKLNSLVHYEITKKLHTREAYN